MSKLLDCRLRAPGPGARIKARFNSESRCLAATLVGQLARRQRDAPHSRQLISSRGNQSFVCPIARHCDRRQSFVDALDQSLAAASVIVIKLNFIAFFGAFDRLSKRRCTRQQALLEIMHGLSQAQGNSALIVGKKKNDLVAYRNAVAQVCLRIAAVSSRLLLRKVCGWEHTIKVERLADPEPATLYPRLIEASGRCPPKDVGGPWGYAEFLEAERPPSTGVMTNSRAGSTKTNSILPRSIPIGSPNLSPRLPNTGRAGPPPSGPAAAPPSRIGGGKVVRPLATSF
jgi:Plasmid pRiA4b ORF-3-like protein